MKVKCIDAGASGARLEVGEVYEVTNDYVDYYTLKEAPSWWRKSRFEVVPEVKRLRMRCVDNAGTALEIGKVYEVIEEEDKLHYRVTGSPGGIEDGLYLKYRFALPSDGDTNKDRSDIIQGLPTEDAERKQIRMYTCFVKYFPLAMAEVAKLSKIANEQHNPGATPHWDMSKSKEELDSMMNHIVDIACGVEVDVADRQLHRTKIAWRAMANLERYLRNIHVQ